MTMTPTKSAAATTRNNVNTPQNSAIATTITNTNNTKQTVATTPTHVTTTPKVKSNSNNTGAMTKFRAHQHKNLRLSNVNSNSNNQNPSAWALASPRFAGPTKYHEAMNKVQKGQNGQRRQTYTPNRYNYNRHHERSNLHLNQRRPNSCILDRRRRINYNDCQGMSELYDMNLPALEVHIPTTTQSLNVMNNSHHDNNEDQYTVMSTISSPPKARKLNLNQYLDATDDDLNHRGGCRGQSENQYMLPISSSLTDSQSSEHDETDEEEDISYDDETNKSEKNLHELENSNAVANDEALKEDGGGACENILGVSSHSTDYESVPWNFPSTTINNADTNRLIESTNKSDCFNKEKNSPFFFHEKHHQGSDNPTAINSTAVASSPSQRKMSESQQSELIATVPRLLLSIQKLESTVANLTSEMKEKDDTIDRLKRNLITFNGHNESVSNADGNRNVEDDDGYKNEFISRELRLSNRQNSLTLNIDNQLQQSPEYSTPLSTKSSSYITDLRKIDEIKLLKELHQNEIMTLTEIHRRDYLDLQDKTLNWIISKSDLMQEQSRELAYARQEMSTLRQNYDELQATANQAFEEAQNAIARNCETLSLYVREEIQESEKAAKKVINQLHCELEDAYDQIARLQNIQYEREEVSLDNGEVRVHEGIKTSRIPHSIPNFKTWSDFSARFRDAISGKLPCDEKKESELDTAAVVKAESLVKELCFDPSVCSTTSLQSDDFLDTFEDANELM